MELYDRIQNLQNLLYKISKFDPQALSELAELYRIILGKTLKITCQDCRMQAYRELTSLTEEKIKAMTNKKFKLKENDQVYFDAQHYLNVNLTDEAAVRMLTQVPTLIAHFENYPTDDDGNLDLSNFNDLPLSADQKELIYKKDGKYYMKVADGTETKLTQKFLKENDVDLTAIPEA